MSSPSKETEEPSSSSTAVPNGAGDDGCSGEEKVEGPRPPAKRPLSTAVIEISDTDSDDSDVCAVSSYQASADEVKRIRGDQDYSSSSSSSSDYSSDSESAWEDDSVLIESEPPPARLVCAQLNPRANRMDDPTLNPTIKSQELIDKFKTHWTEQKDLSTPEVTLSCSPFRLGLLHGLLANPDMINNIVDDMNTLDWSRKKMDLYEFHQTADLASLTWQRSIRGIHELLKTEVMSWVSEVTGLELTSVSASCSLYGPGDHLLVHDDLLGTRRVAFILYLCPWTCPPQRDQNGDDHVDVDNDTGWSAHMGGALELLARDEDGKPTDVARSVTPANNMLAFFQVGPETFHQVGEVLSLELPRLSINGWFHSAGGEEPPAPPDPAPPDQHKPHSDPVVMQTMLEATYMTPRSRAAIQTQMEQRSEVCLRDLLQIDYYTSLLEALRQEELPWERAGPGNERRYLRLPAQYAESLPAEHPVRQLLKMAAGAAWFRLLHDCTDLALTKYERLELQKWSPGDFTLLPPRSQYASPRLEAVLYLGLPARPVCGAATTYLAPEEHPAPNAEPDAALVTVPPVSNALSLVYCDAGAAGFTKYLSKMTMAPTDHFFILTCTYRE
ncbi:prolyl 3-hydroxylase sudestada1 [Leguminivora glycinivorella]|uniref:prolyl 3-hydroxylase sudestada1 n=1 Tax=Leguminivora glycinivorella TaxID=1035111 RepID=UPI00200C0562|nr:prolyl 3-hydroxylase sudestada1 [Leguminivora glycinivorella]